MYRRSSGCSSTSICAARMLHSGRNDSIAGQLLPAIPVFSQGPAKCAFSVPLVTPKRNLRGVWPASRSLAGYRCVWPLACSTDGPPPRQYSTVKTSHSSPLNPPKRTDKTENKRVVVCRKPRKESATLAVCLPGNKRKWRKTRDNKATSTAAPREFEPTIDCKDSNSLVSSQAKCELTLTTLIRRCTDGQLYCFRAVGQGPAYKQGTRPKPTYACYDPGR